MRIRSVRIAVLLAATVVAACSSPDKQSPVAPRSPTGPDQVRTPRSDGYIVVLKPASSASLSRMRPGARLANLIAVDDKARDGVVGDVIPKLNAFVVRGVTNADDLASADVEAVIPNYEADIIDPVMASAGLVAEASGPLEPSGSNPSGAFFFANNTQWGLKKSAANRVWAPSRGGAGTRACIIDSGIDAGHPEFAGKILMSTTFVANSAAGLDSNAHGTHVAGIVTNRGIGGGSVAPDAMLMTAKVFAGNGGGGSTSAIANAVIWCTDNGADIINMSLGFTGGIPRTAANQPLIDFMQAVVDYATSRGVVVITSAGNDAATMPSSTLIFLPAEANGATAVASTGPSSDLTPFGINAVWSAPGTEFEGISSFSNRGPAPSVDLSAPGGNRPFATWPVQGLILSVCSRQACGNPNVYVYFAGTSQAAPHVTGVAAIIRGRFPATPRSTAFRAKIESCLYRSVDNIGSTNIFGRGRVNAYKAATQPC